MNDAGKVTLHRLTEDIGGELLQFEWENRSFFETMALSREDEHYILERFLEALKGLLAEQTDGTSYMHIIRDEEGSIIGRINVTNIKNKKAE